MEGDILKKQKRFRRGGTEAKVERRNETWQRQLKKIF
jgi:hypothetical protein